MNDAVLSVSDFIAICNQTLEYAYPAVTIVGELANFRVSKNRWVYFDLKDEYSSVKFFGTIYQLPGPLEDGLLLQVSAQPRLHPQYGFSLNIQFMQPVGEGSLRRAANLLEAKLTAEGLFDSSRKRLLPYPPQRIGLITSGESAAYKDFVKILGHRWAGLEVILADTQVQGELAIPQIIAALEYFNSHSEPVDVIVITRGGGSADDLAVFNAEQVTRAVAASRIPTLVAIGHEIDVSLAELAADQRASTPSHAAELLVPDQKHLLQQLKGQRESLGLALARSVEQARQQLDSQRQELLSSLQQLWQETTRTLRSQSQLLTAFSPEAVLRRGYAIVRRNNKVIRSVKQVAAGQSITITVADGHIESRVQ